MNGKVSWSYTLVHKDFYLGVASETDHREDRVGRPAERECWYHDENLNKDSVSWGVFRYQARGGVQDLGGGVLSRQVQTI